jgi:class 3 adenylate cyclase/alpha-beta hydrolase superfamily lysophospholipase
VGQDVVVGELPETRYAAVGDADVAYQMFGQGPPELVVFWGLGGHVELNWDTPGDAALLERLSSIARVVVFDRRGTGASDGVVWSAIPTWEDWTEDLVAVMDAVGWERAAISAEWDAGPIAILFAATHPERVTNLVLSNTTARYLSAPDYPVGLQSEIVDRGVRRIGKLWGTVELARESAPGHAVDDTSVRNEARCARASATPRSAEAQLRYFAHVDVRDALPLIQAPTLVVHSDSNPAFPLGQGEYLAAHIANAKLVVWRGGPGTATDAPDRFVNLVGEFLTGQRPVTEPDRVLASILFTDIVGSTDRAAMIGDARWRQVLDVHDLVVRQQLGRFGGREINTTGDGFVAAFDGPARAIRCGQALIHDLQRKGIQVRAGCHTGECERRAADLAGLAVHIAARIAAAAAPSQLLVSSTVRDLVLGSRIEFRDAGQHELKGVPGIWTLLAAHTETLND